MVSSPFDDHNKFLLYTVSYAVIKSAELSTVKCKCRLLYVYDQSLLKWQTWIINFSYLLNQLIFCTRVDKLIFLIQKKNCNTTTDHMKKTNDFAWSLSWYKLNCYVLSKFKNLNAWLSLLNINFVSDISHKWNKSRQKLDNCWHTTSIRAIKSMSKT